jgi:hypothetical protein
VQIQNVLLAHLKALILTFGDRPYRNLWITVEHRAVNGTSQAHVNFSHPGLLDDACGILVINAAAGHDRDPAARGLYQPGDPVNARAGGSFSAGGQEPVRAGFADAFQSKKKICGRVERPMESNVEWPSQLDQLPCAFRIYAAASMEDA